MGFKLSQAFNPFSGIGLLEGGKSSGPQNPYGPQDLSFLDDTSGLDFLRDPISSKFSDPSEALFQRLLGSINAPSSVDEVSRRLESELLGRTLEDIDLDTQSALADQEVSSFERGLFGPGISSDIAESGFAGIRSEGAKRKADARIGLSLRELERQKAKEEAVRSAFGARFSQGSNLYADLLGLESGREGTLAQLINARDLGKAGIGADLFTTGEERKNRYAKPSIFEEILRNTNLGFEVPIG